MKTKIAPLTPNCTDLHRFSHYTLRICTNISECTSEMATIHQTANGSWRVQIRRNGKCASRNLRL